jgi:hypothetical protein
MAKPTHTFLLLGVTVLGAGCEARYAQRSNPTVLEGLASWNVVPDIVLGDRDAQGHDFVDPVPLGSNLAGRIFVLDRRLLVIREFDEDGRFNRDVVRAGQGPGEMRLASFSHGLMGDTLWFSEIPTGRVHLIDTAGRLLRTEATGFSPDRLGVEWVSLSRIAGGNGYWIQTRAVSDAAGDELLPTNTMQLLRGGTAETSEIVHAWESPAGSFRFDNGGTLVRYPGPAERPLVLPHSNGTRIVEIRRSARPSGGLVHAEVTAVEVGGGEPRRRQFAFPAVPLPDSVRASFEQSVIEGATWGGARQLDASTRSRIRDLANSIPGYQPAVVAGVLGPDHTVWLRIPHEDSDQQLWIVLDEQLVAVARVTMPSNLVSLVTHDGHGWWATLAGEHGTTYVARLMIGMEPHS